MCDLDLMTLKSNDSSTLNLRVTHDTNFGLGKANGHGQIKIPPPPNVICIKYAKTMITLSNLGLSINTLNKRAQRALGRSPEEKVKGHSGANNRDPQGHNLNNFGKGPFDDAIY